MLFLKNIVLNGMSDMSGTDFISPLQGLSVFNRATRGVAPGFMDFAPLGLDCKQSLLLLSRRSNSDIGFCLNPLIDIKVMQGPFQCVQRGSAVKHASAYSWTEPNANALEEGQLRIAPGDQREPGERKP